MKEHNLFKFFVFSLISLLILSHPHILCGENKLKFLKINDFFIFLFFYFCFFTNIKCKTWKSFVYFFYFHFLSSKVIIIFSCSISGQKSSREINFKCSIFSCLFLNNFLAENFVK